MAEPEEKKVDEPIVESKQDSELTDAECEKVAGGGIVIEEKNLQSAEVLPSSLAANLNVRVK